MDNDELKCPSARKDMLTHRVDDELLVYDPELEKAHCLDDTAAKV